MKSPEKPKLTVWCLGGSELALDGGPRFKLRKKVGELLALLLIARGKSCSRSIIVNRLWPNAEGEAGKINLRTHLTYLRHALKDQETRLVSEGQSLRFDLTNAEVDFLVVQKAITTAKQMSDLDGLESALAALAHPLLPSSCVSAIVDERDRLCKLYLTELDFLAEKLVEVEQRERAVKVLRCALDTDPIREKSAAFILHLLANDIKLMSDVMMRFRKAWGEAATGRPINEHIEALYVRLKYRRDHPRPIAPSPNFPRIDHIPFIAHPLVGRDDELRLIRLRLAQYRFVSLLGVGGVGKTRLAMEICNQDRYDYPGGVVFVELGGKQPGASQELIAESVAALLDITDGKRPFTDLVMEMLQPRHLLLVLDNCEDLQVECAGWIRLLLETCPLVNILVTSQIELASDFGNIIRIQPFDIPPGDQQLTIEALRAMPVVRLFESLAIARRPWFQITEENAIAIASICRATDGLPLAVQLVASNNTLTFGELEEQLTGGFAAVELAEDLMMPDQSRTVQKSVAWSCRLLSSRDEALFLGLSVFAGGWTEQAVEAIFASASIAPLMMVTVLHQLNAKSLVERRELAGRSRYYMLRPIREYARHRLKESGIYYEVALRHLDYYLKQAELTANLKEGDELNEALLMLTWDQENLLAALDYSLVVGETEKALRMAAALARYWYLRGRHNEGHAWLEQVLTISADAPAVVRRNALNGAGVIAYVRHDYCQAEAFWRECLELSQNLNDETGVLQAQGNLGNIAVAREDFSTAQALFETCLEGFRARNNLNGMALVSANLAMVARGLADYPLACKLHEQSITLFRSLSDKHNTTLGLNNLADTLIFLERYQNAHSVLSQVIDLCGQDNLHSLAHCLTNYVMLAAGEDQQERAAILIGAHDALRERIQSSLPAKAGTQFQQVRHGISSQLGDELFMALSHAGAHLSLDALCRYVSVSKRHATD